MFLERVRRLKTLRTHSKNRESSHRLIDFHTIEEYACARNDTSRLIFQISTKYYIVDFIFRD